MELEKTLPTSKTRRRRAALLAHRPNAPSHLPITHVRIVKQVVIVNANFGTAVRVGEIGLGGRVVVACGVLESVGEAFDVAGWDEYVAAAVGEYVHGVVVGGAVRVLSGADVVVDGEGAGEDDLGRGWDSEGRG